MSHICANRSENIVIRVSFLSLSLSLSLVYLNVFEFEFSVFIYNFSKVTAHERIQYFYYSLTVPNTLLCHCLKLIRVSSDCEKFF
jgi:hypothetical protein